MRFRININSKTAEWEVQICRWGGLWWQSLPTTFDSYYEAEDWAIDQGLPETYVYQHNLELINYQPEHRSTGEWLNRYNQRRQEARDKANRAVKKAKVLVHADLK
jgi:hypothetical protein